MNRMFDTLCAGSVYSIQKFARRQWEVETIEMEGYAPHSGERVLRVRKYHVLVSKTAKTRVVCLMNYSVFQHAFEQA